MEAHPYFDLLLHSNAELAGELGEPVVRRMTLHEWPLSCVQRVTTDSSRTFIYKASAEPTVEPEFYARARSPLLVPARTLYRDAQYACLLLEDIFMPGLETQPASEREALAVGRSLLAQIAAIEGNPPVYLDIGTLERWHETIDATLDGLSFLARSGKYRQLDSAALEVVTAASRSEDVAGLFSYPAGGSGLVHNDLTVENIFRAGEKYRLIDWQRPLKAPVEVDLARLLVSLRVDPRSHVSAGALAVADLLLVHWFVECSLKWFPPAIPDYDRAVAEIISRL